MAAAYHLTRRIVPIPLETPAAVYQVVINITRVHPEMFEDFGQVELALRILTGQQREPPFNPVYFIGRLHLAVHLNRGGFYSNHRINSMNWSELNFGVAAFDHFFQGGMAVPITMISLMVPRCETFVDLYNGDILVRRGLLFDLFQYNYGTFITQCAMYIAQAIDEIEMITDTVDVYFTHAHPLGEYRALIDIDYISWSFILFRSSLVRNIEVRFGGVDPEDEEFDEEDSEEEDEMEDDAVEDSEEEDEMEDDAVEDSEEEDEMEDDAVEDSEDDEDDELEDVENQVAVVDDVEDQVASADNDAVSDVVNESSVNVSSVAASNDVSNDDGSDDDDDGSDDDDSSDGDSNDVEIIGNEVSLFYMVPAHLAEGQSVCLDNGSFIVRDHDYL